MAMSDRTFKIICTAMAMMFGVLAGAFFIRGMDDTSDKPAAVDRPTGAVLGNQGENKDENNDRKISESEFQLISDEMYDYDTKVGLSVAGSDIKDVEKVAIGVCDFVDGGGSYLDLAGQVALDNGLDFMDVTFLYLNLTAVTCLHDSLQTL